MYNSKGVLCLFYCDLCKFVLNDAHRFDHAKWRGVIPLAVKIGENRTKVSVTQRLTSTVWWGPRKSFGKTQILINRKNSREMEKELKMETTLLNSWLRSVFLISESSYLSLFKLLFQKKIPLFYLWINVFLNDALIDYWLTNYLWVD